MGHATSSYLLQTSQYGGTYRNPFKQGGKGVKYTKWVTVNGRPSGATMDEVKAMWQEAYAKRNESQLQRFRVTFKGKTVIDQRGRVYEKYTQPGEGGETWMRYVETLPGMEDAV
jgi:hypothetical protein